MVVMVSMIEEIWSLITPMMHVANNDGLHTWSNIANKVFMSNVNVHNQTCIRCTCKVVAKLNMHDANGEDGN